MSCEGKLSAACAAVAPPGSAAAAALGDDPTGVLEEVYRVAQSRSVQTVATGRKTTGALREQLHNRVAADMTVAFFTYLRDHHGIPPDQLPAHGQGRDGVPLPKPASCHGYAAVWQTLRAAIQGQPLPPLAREVLTTRQQRRVAAAQAAHVATADLPPLPDPPRPGKRVPITVGGADYTILGGPEASFEVLVAGLRQTFDLDGSCFRHRPNPVAHRAPQGYWDIPASLPEVIAGAEALGVGLVAADGQTLVGLPVPVADARQVDAALSDLLAREPVLGDLANGQLAVGAQVPPSVHEALFAAVQLARLPLPDGRPHALATQAAALRDTHLRTGLSGQDVATFTQALLAHTGATRCPVCGQFRGSAHDCPGSATFTIAGIPKLRRGGPLEDWLHTVAAAPGVRAMIRNLGSGKRSELGQLQLATAAQRLRDPRFAHLRKKQPIVEAWAAQALAATTPQEWLTAASVLGQLRVAPALYADHCAQFVQHFSAGLCALANQEVVTHPVEEGLIALLFQSDTPKELEAAIMQLPPERRMQQAATLVCVAGGMDRCGNCGQFRSARSGHRCPTGTVAQVVDGDMALPAARTLVGGDPIDNEAIAGMFSRIATAIAGAPRRVMFGAPGSGFATNMQGRIMADPQPLPAGATLGDQLLAVNAGIYHELGHEQYTPPELWADMLTIARSDAPVTRTLDLGFAGLGSVDITLDALKGQVPRCYNIIEDGRMERAVSADYRGVAEILAADALIDPRWDQTVGERVPTRHQVEGALLYTALPYFAVSPEARAGMSPDARRLFAELEPVVAAAVVGRPEDAASAALYLAWRLEQEGLATPPPPSAVKPRPDTPPEPQERPPDQPGQPQPGQGGPGGQQGQQAGQQGQPDQSDPQGNQQNPQDGQQRAGEPKGQPQQGQQGQQGRQQGDQQGQPGGQQQGQGGQPGNQPGQPGEQRPQPGQRGQGGQPGGQPDPSDPPGQGGQGGQPGQPGGQPQPQPSSGSGGPPDGQQGDQAGQRGQQPNQGGVGGTRGDWSESVTSGPRRDVQQPFGVQDFEAVRNRLATQAGMVLGGLIRTRNRPEAMGQALHQPLRSVPTSTQRSRSQGGHIQAHQVMQPTANPSLVAELATRRRAHQAVARQLATQLAAIRDATEQRFRKQTEGRLDRGRLVAAVTGQDTVRTRTQIHPATRFAASVAVDMSGSMSHAIQSAALYDAVRVLGDTFDQLDIPFEVRAFGTHTAQMKSIGDPAFDEQRAAALASWSGGGTRLLETAQLTTTALQGCPERNKISITLTDGDLGDHNETVAQLAEARKQGIVTFGLFFGTHASADRMDELYGVGNWTTINELSDMPTQVGRRLATIFKRLQPH
ncbi:hypothetical protein F8S13_22665 [Chloroflexia bacterium SDU3-3]|nr:hypothetical protein F8S13_22665 [Chloroflexia bacterium SDU3-3]